MQNRCRLHQTTVIQSSLMLIKTMDFNAKMGITRLEINLRNRRVGKSAHSDQHSSYVYWKKPYLLSSAQLNLCSIFRVKMSTLCSKLF